MEGVIRFLPPEMMHLMDTEQSFQFDSRERRHVNQVHEGMKPYQCEQSDCMRSFTSKGGLDRHITDHTGEFPFLCPECP